MNIVRRSLGALAVAVSVGAVSLAPIRPVLAEGEITIDAVDASGAPQITLEVSVPGDLTGIEVGPEQVTVTENGAAREVSSVTPAGTSGLQLMIVFDRSGSMEGEPLAAAKAAADSFVRRLPADVEAGLVVFGNRAVAITAPTLDRTPVLDGLAAATATGETALYDAVQLAAAQFGTLTTRRAIVVLSDGGDTVSRLSLGDAVLATAYVQVNVIELASGDTDPVALATLAQGTPVRSALVPTDLASAYDEVLDALVNRFRITYTSAAPGDAPAEVSVAMSLSGVVHSSAARTVEMPPAPSTTAPATSTTAPPPSTTVATTLPVATGSIDSGIPLFGVLLVFAGIFTVVFMLGLRPDRRMRGRLQPLGASRAATAAAATEDGESGLTKMLGDLGWEEHIERALDDAGSTVPVQRFVATATLTSFGVAIASALVLGPIGAVLGLALTPLWLRNRLRRKGAKRRALFVEQLPDVLQIMTSMLKSGYAFMQSLDAVANEAPDPSKEWFSRVVLEVRTGRDMVESLRALADRLDGDDFKWVVSAIEINREVGGDLAVTLDNVAETIRERGRLRRQVQTLTAEGRMSAYLMLALPPIVAVLSLLTNPDFIGVLFKGAGIVVIIIAVALMGLGYVWMRKIVDKVSL